MNNILQFASQVESIRTLKDGSLKVVLETQELGPEDKTKLFEFGSKEVWTAIKENPVKLEELNIEEVEPEFKKEKSPSQQMRNIIYRIWETTTSKTKPFPDFYKAYMFKLNEVLKEKIKD